MKHFVSKLNRLTKFSNIEKDAALDSLDKKQKVGKIELLT